MKTCIIIPCCKDKLLSSEQAQKLYLSPFFKAAKKVAVESNYDWYILSAKYGLIKPDTVIKPYNMVFKLNGGRMYRQNPRPEVVSKLEAKRLKDHANWILSGYEKRIYLMGKTYTTGLLDGEEPLAGMGIGDQLKLLKTLKV